MLQSFSKFSLLFLLFILSVNGISGFQIKEKNHQPKNFIEKKDNKRVIKTSKIKFHESEECFCIELEPAIIDGEDSFPVKIIKTVIKPFKLLNKLFKSEK